MPVFSIPLSGLTASSTALSAIANNLANLNTVGYKQTRATFRDLFYQTIGTTGSGDAIQIGAGATVGSVSTVFTGGNVESSGVPTDVAISGEGFFVVQRDGQRQFTRAGNFTVDNDGFLMTPDGYQVLGYGATNGTIDAGAGLVPIQVGRGQPSAPHATENISMKSNLDASSAVGTEFSSDITVHDSLGSSHIISIKFTKDATSNQWSYEASIPAADVGATGAAVVLGTGTLNFDGNGHLTSPLTSPSFTAAKLADGASDLTFTWNLRDTTSAGLMTQMAATSDTTSTSQDGSASGSLLEFSISPNGMVQGSFTNGTQVLAQLALASFANPQGLSRVGHNSFESSLSSGQPSVGTPGAGGRGMLAGGSLELSNVDIAKEFAQLIMAQRGFQANARVITTFDEITQETINLKR